MDKSLLPVKLPIVKIISLMEDEEMLKSISQIEVKEDPSFFSSFTAPDSYIWCDYDLPHGFISNIHRGQLSLELLLNGGLVREVMIESSDCDDHPTGNSLYYFKDEGGYYRWHLLIDRPTEDQGQIQICHRQVPKTIKPNDIFISKEIYYSGSEQVIVPIKERIDGPFMVHIGSNKAICLRWLISASYEDRSHITETYLTTSDGKVWLFRRFNSQEFDNYEDLFDCPSIEEDGKVYRLWYVSLVHHA